jgi:hypothetical protein
MDGAVVGVVRAEKLALALWGARLRAIFQDAKRAIKVTILVSDVITTKRRVARCGRTRTYNLFISSRA